MPILIGVGFGYGLQQAKGNAHWRGDDDNSWSQVDGDKQEQEEALTEAAANGWIGRSINSKVYLVEAVSTDLPTEAAQVAVDDERVALVVDVGPGHDHRHHPGQRNDLTSARLAVDFDGRERMDYGVVSEIKKGVRFSNVTCNSLKGSQNQCSDQNGSTIFKL